MSRLAIASVLLASIFLAAVTAQDEKKKSNPPPVTGKAKTPSKAPMAEAVPGECEIVFLNGSKVRLIIQTDKLDISTIYGNLSVPIQDVLAVEFGLHFPDGHIAKIDAAVRGLGSSDFRVRENAARALVELGPYSYAAVLRAGRMKDAEIAGRAKEVAQKLQAKFAKKDLRTMVEDKVVTPTQTIVGHIVTTTVKTKAEYFGEVEHKLAHMRTLRTVAASSHDLDVVIEAAKFAVQGQWMDTTFQVDGQTALVITAKGVTDVWPQQAGQYLAGPNGVNNGGNIRFGNGGMQVAGRGQRIVGPITPQIYGGMLIGKIGATGEPFVLGDRYEGKPEAEGKLYLHIGPSPWNCPSNGSYEVKIARKND